MRHASLKFLWAAALLAAAIPGRARAEDTAKLVNEKAGEAAALEEQGNDEAALQKALEAEALAGPLGELPALTLFSARLHVKTAKLVEAQERYRHIVALDIDKLEAPAKAQWDWRATQKRAQAAARKELEELAPRVPLLTVTVTGAEPSALKVSVDGRPFEPAQLDQPVPQNPGKHTITAEAPGMIRTTRDVELKEGGKETVKLALVPVPEAPASTSRSVPVGAVVAWGVGGVGLVAGVVAGSFVLLERSKAEKVCDFPAPTGSDDGCGSSYLDSMYIASYVSTAGVAVAVAGALAGTALFILSPRKASPRSASVALGLGFVSVKGSF